MKQNQNNWNQTSYSCRQKRLIYDNLAASGPGGAEDFDLNAKADKLREIEAEPVTSSKPVTFIGNNIDGTIQALAKSVYKDGKKVTAYMGKIKTSLEYWVKEVDDNKLPFGLNGLWDFLTTNNCQKATIIKGELEFYNGSGEKIQIGELLSAKFPAITTLDKVAIKIRGEIIDRSLTTRSNFVNVNTDSLISKANPEQTRAIYGLQQNLQDRQPNIQT